MVGSLESDIQDVCNVQFDNRDVIDDFDDDNNDDRSSCSFHKMEVCTFIDNITYKSFRVDTVIRNEKRKGPIFSLPIIGGVLKT